ncbi:2-hydroxyacid dehydrogenase [Sphingomonadaceae bacterium OTU29MARTA1]|nr:2-hydroxyacid dehydrogenase [Sphingomonadaceae bacterium OTU29MARTA1]
MSKPLAIQLCPFSPYLTEALVARFELWPWFERNDGQRDALLADRGGAIRAVVTGGHIGCPNDLIDRLSAPAVIAINGVGFDKVDLDHARAAGMRVTNTPDVLTEDVADLAVGLIIGLLRALPAADRHVRDGRWPDGEVPLGRKVSGRRFGIVGLGRIGSAIAARVAPFGAVSYTDLAAKPAAWRFVPDLIELAMSSDVLILASAANGATRHLVGREVLEALGPDGYLVNVARGSLIDEQALAAALEEGRIAGAALDVFENEPHVPEALRANGRLMLSPHIASATVETRTAMAELVLANLDAFVSGRDLPTPVA